ncbi:MAG: protein kinase domain-containing protein [Terriglobales bacterium]
MALTVEKIGRYEIVSELGRGAMGLVYRAVDPNIGRTVALKTMRLDVHGMEHDDMLRRFKNEARAAGVMNHSNIVTIYDAGEADGLFYIAMEYIEGKTLQSIMMEKRMLPSDQIIDVGVQVCAGLDYAHEMKVIHRDIKPANIMITSQNVAKIMDFGISKAAGSLTSNSQVLGTPNYMAPEQVKGLDINGRADLFSFGVVLYEMATGERPFAGQNVTTIIYKIVNENPVPPSEVEMSVHPGLSAVISKCLRKDPEERYKTGAALAHDLQNYRSLGADGDITSVLQRDAHLATQVAPPPSNSSSSGTRIAGRAAVATGSQTRKGQTAKQSVSVAKGASALSRASNWNKKAVATTLIAFAVVLSAAGLYRFKHRVRAAASVPAVTSAALIAQVPPQIVQPAPQKPSEKQPKAVVSRKPAHVAAHGDEKEQTQSPDEKVQIHFRTNPEGAFVQIDGQSSDAWVTPFTMPDVTPGAHEVVFTKSGYSAETRSLKIGSRNSTYSASLVPITTALSLTSEPPGADIEIDGKDTTRMTPAQIPVAEGEHTIVLRLDGYHEQQVTATVKKGMVFQFSPILNPGDAPQAGNTSRLGKIFGSTFRGGKGIVDFVTTPPGAKIFIRGRAAAIATPAHAAFAPGSYHIELREPGYKPVQQTVVVEPGQISKVEVTLDPQ